MDAAKAQSVISALISAGYAVRASKVLTVVGGSPVEVWTVTADGAEIQASAVADFATGQGVSGTVTTAKFI